MSRIAYVNGRYLPHARRRASISRTAAIQFADGVYEVCEVRDGRLIDEARHMARLKRSLGELRIGWPMEPAALGVVMREVVRRNRVRDGIVYLQVTRGVAPRNHAFPRGAVTPALVVTARSVGCRAAGEAGGGGGRGHHRPRQPVGAGRHQDRRSAAECAGQAEGQGSRGLRGVVRRSRRLRHGRIVDQCLDRDRPTAAS